MSETQTKEQCARCNKSIWLHQVFDYQGIWQEGDTCEQFMKRNELLENRHTVALIGSGPLSELPSDGDLHWHEDFSHENGKYYCKCVHCNASFLGYKRRVGCKRCHVKHIESQNETLARELALTKQKLALARDYIQELADHGFQNAGLLLAEIEKLEEKK